MRRTDVRGVDLSSTRGITQEQLNVAIGDVDTLFPAHLQRPRTWLPYEQPSTDGEGEVPLPLPATVEVAIQAGRLNLAENAGDALFTTSFDESELRRSIIDDLSNIIHRLSNTGALAHSAQKYLECLSSEQLNIILLGMRGEGLSAQVSRISNSTDSEDYLLPDVLGALNGIVIQHHLFVNQSHKWRSFREEAQRANFQNGDRHRSIDDASGLADVLSSHYTVANPEVPKALERAMDEVKDGNNDAKLSVFNLYASIANILRVVTGWAVREFKKGGTKTWASFRDTIATQIGVTGAGLVGGLTVWFVASKLAARWPEYFGWYEFFVNLMK